MKTQKRSKDFANVINGPTKKYKLYWQKTKKINFWEFSLHIWKLGDYI